MTAPTLFIAMVTAAIDVLKAPAPVCTQIDRVRLRPVAAGQDEAVVVRPGRSLVTQATTSGVPISWTTTLFVECYAKSGADTAADEAVGPLVAAVYARLMSDVTLGGAVIGLQPKGYDPEFDADGQQATCATLVFEVLQRAAGITLL